MKWTRVFACFLVAFGSAAATPANETSAPNQNPSALVEAQHAEPAPSETGTGAAVSSAAVSSAAVSSDSEKAVLYTIGSGPALFERWGHSLLCFQPASAFLASGALASPEAPDTEALIDTSCFDFGIFPRSSLASIVSGSLRGEPLFVPRELFYQNGVGRYWWLDRTVQRQVLPLSAEQVFDLRDRLNEVVLRGEGYAYHPFYNNCSTQVRDVLDEFSGGELRGKDSVRGGPSLRAFAEQGFSGQMLLLAGMELLVGTSADRAASQWQRGAFPEGLKALVEHRWGVKGHVVYKQTWNPLPTSIHAGRLLLLLTCAAVCGGLVWARRRGEVSSAQWRSGVGAFGVLVAAVGLLSVFLRFYSVYPEFASSWTPLIFFPLDAALPWMGATARKRYIGGRLVFLVILGLLSLLHLLAQPVVTVAVFVGLPLGLILFLESREKAGADSFAERFDSGSGGAAETS